MSRTATLLAALAFVPISALAQTSRACPADPYASPETDTCNPLRYIPIFSVNLLAAILYFVVAVALTAWAFKRKANWFMCLVIGAWCEGIGLVLRLVLRKNPHSQGIYIAQYLFVVLSPCAFLAGDYILLGRMVDNLDADRYLKPLKWRFVSWTFIISDVVTFLIQAAGGGLSISKDLNQAKAGGRIFLAGIAAQFASFTLFTGMWALFFIRAYRNDKPLWNKPGWKPLYWALGFTCICFLIRSVFRTVELSQGYIGYLATHEVYYLALDTLPLFLGILTYTYFWPGKYINPSTRTPRESEKPHGGDAELDAVGGSAAAVPVSEFEAGHGHGHTPGSGAGAGTRAAGEAGLGPVLGPRLGGSDESGSEKASAEGPLRA